MKLTDVFKAMAADEQGLHASAHVEARLREEVRAVARARRRRAAGASVAAAASLAVLVSVPVWKRVQRAQDASQAVATATGRDGAQGASEVATEFLPLPYSTVPMTNGEVVRLEVPRGALVSFGLAPADASALGTVTADVIVGEDGLARAVRFVRPAGRVAGQEQMP